MDLQKQLDLFHATPPRLFPHQPEQRAMLERLLAMLAATDPELYEERFEVYNKFCDELQVPRFGRVTIVREVQPTPPLPVEEVPSTEVVEAPEVVETVEEVKVEEKPKRKRRKSDHSSPNVQ